MEDLSLFKQMTRKLPMKKGAISKKEIYASYFEEVKNDLMQNMDIEKSDDISMAFVGNTTEDDEICAAGES